MRATWVVLAAAAAGSTVANGQGVSEWRTARGVPVAVVEVAGGDVEHLVALLPADAAPPATVTSFTAQLRPRRASQLWSVAVPSLAAQPALAEFLAALGATGSAAVVALGPVPAREIAHSSAAFDAIPVRAPVRERCVLAEGALAERRGAPDALELVLGLPQPDDPRFDLVPALVALVRSRLAPAFPALRADADVRDGCARLVVSGPVSGETPRAALQRLRQALGQLAATPAGEAETARAAAACQVRSTRVAVDGAALAAELADRLALGGSAAGALSVPALDAGALTELAREVLSGHPGEATIVEQERRLQAEPSRTLDNGVEVAVTWIPGEAAVVALALGGVAPRVGHDILAAAATSAARNGWPAAVGEVAGVPTLAVAAPASAVADVMERVSESVAAARPAARDDLEAEATRALGLADALTGETLSVALALPPEVELGGEAAEKFFGSFASGQVSAGAAPVRPGLNWTAGAGAPEEVAVAELPASAAGLLARQVLRDRLSAESGVRAGALAPPGRIVLAVACAGGRDVPALDARLAGAWKRALRPVSAAEAGAAARALLAAMFGDAAQAAARTAAATFLPVVPDQAALLAVDAAQVSGALAGLPAWSALTRFARGAAPPPPARPGRTRDVRKSDAPRERER